MNLSRAFTIVSLLGFVGYLCLHYQHILRGNLRENVHASIFMSPPLRIMSTPTPATALSRISIQDDVFLYSAINLDYIGDTCPPNRKQKRKTKSTKTCNTTVNHSIIINGWKRNSISTLKCCYFFRNGSINEGEKASVNTDVYKVKIHSAQFFCSPPDVASVHAVTLAMNGTNCPQNASEYLKTTHALQPNQTDSVAVCAKIAYHDLDARALVEWFEVNRLFGVDQIVIYTHQLNEKAYRVIRYYENLGYATVFPFDLPKEKWPAMVGKKVKQAWSDEQVVLFDCQTRLYNYEYVSVTDTDEYVFVHGQRFNLSLKSYLKEALTQTRKGYIGLYANMHITEWEKSNKTSELIIEQYKNASDVHKFRPKNIYMPKRTVFGRVFTHKVFIRQGYIGTLKVYDDISMHHFRKCSKEWNKTETIDLKSNASELSTTDSDPNVKAASVNICFKIESHSVTFIEEIARLILDNVRHVRKTLQL